MLQLRPNCECCNADLAGDSDDAYICSFECTFCTRCASVTLEGQVSELWRRAGASPAAPGGKAAEISGLDASASSNPKVAGSALPETALICRVPEAERYIAHYRERYDPPARRKVPAHVTVLYPFMAPDLVTTSGRARCARSRPRCAASTYRLAETRRFPVALYLAPEPDDSFAALTGGVCRAFPDYPPFEGKFDTVVPHVTVAHGDEPPLCEIEVELRIALAAGRRARALQGNGAHRKFPRPLGTDALFRARLNTLEPMKIESSNGSRCKSHTCVTPGPSANRWAGSGARPWRPGWRTTAWSTARVTA